MPFGKWVDTFRFGPEERLIGSNRRELPFCLPVEKPPSHALAPNWLRKEGEGPDNCLGQDALVKEISNSFPGKKIK